MNNFPRRAFVTSDGVQLSYIRQGSGCPIVLVHGWSQCAEEFKYQIEPLSVRYDVIAPDKVEPSIPYCTTSRPLRG